MEQAKRITQADRVLKMLKEWGWTSGLVFTNYMEPRIMCYTKRISELRAKGYPIEKRRNHQGFWEYRLKP